MFFPRPKIRLILCCMGAALLLAAMSAAAQNADDTRPPRSPWTKAYRLLMADKPDDAAEAAAQVLKSLPGSALGNLIMAMALAGDGEQAKAMGHLNKALAGDPAGEAQFLHERAALLADLGQAAEASHLAELGLKLAPGHVGPLAGRALSLLASGENLAEAEDLAARTVRAMPDSPEAWELLGTIQQKRREHAQAVISLHKALRLDPPDKARVEQMLLDSMAKLPPDKVRRLTK